METLESRSMMTADFDVTFNIPADVQNRGFYAAIFGNLTADYTQQGTTNVIPGGTNVYFDFSLNGGAGDYASLVGENSLVAQQLTGNSFSLNLPNTPVQAGQIVMGVGSSPDMPVDSTTGDVTSPTASNNAENYFALFEYDVAVSAVSVNDPNVLDIDVSNVDQLGFPFTVTTDPAGAFPADLGVGIPVDRADVFQMYEDYINAIGQTDSAALAFLDSLTYGNGYRILAPQNVLDNQSGGPIPTGVTYSANGSLTLDMPYYYWITATSASGETMAENFASGTPYENSGTGVNYQTINVNWQAFEGATGYKVYRSETSDINDANLVATISGGSTLTWADNGSSAGTPATPPTTNYTFNALNSYFNNDLDAFFNHYTQANGNEFSIDRDGSTFTGYVQTDYQFGGTGEEYTALVLNSTDYVGQDFVILKPYFNTNTPDATAPAPPNWLQNSTQSPGAMVLANDGVFNTGGEQPGVNAGVLSDLQNSIVNAFNRGIATNFDLQPTYWANSPLLDAAEAVTGTGLSTGRYYYVVTGTNPNPSGGVFESVISPELFAYTSGSTRNVQLTLQPLTDSVYANYNIYRKFGPTGTYELLTSVANNDGNGNPLISFLDDDSYTPTAQTPPTYFAAGTASNWYGAFLVQNITNYPTTGLSIRGLAYGYAYGDQNGYSTNFTTNVVDGLTVTIDVSRWSGEIAAPEKIVVLSQPEVVKVKQAVTLEFQAQNHNGSGYAGGGTVMVEVLGTKKKYEVELDEVTGEGSLTLTNLKEGMYSFKIKYEGGPTVTTDVFSVVPKKTSQKVMDIFAGIDSMLNTKAMKNALKAITKYGSYR